MALTGLGALLLQPREQSWVNPSVTDLRRADCDGLWLHEVNLDRSARAGALLRAAGRPSARARRSPWSRGLATAVFGVLAPPRIPDGAD